MSGQDTRVLLKEGAAELGVDLTQIQIDQFITYLENLKLWNKRINLTAINDEQEIVISHFLDSISVVPLLEPNKSLLDIGSGAGFPGIPIKIVSGSLDITLMDSVNKKVSFMKDVIRTLGLRGITAIWGRAEDEANAVDRSGFDYVVTRALGEILALVELSAPYLKPGGQIILMRGKAGVREWNEALQHIGANFRLIGISEFDLPFGAQSRVILKVGTKMP